VSTREQDLTGQVAELLKHDGYRLIVRHEGEAVRGLRFFREPARVAIARRELNHRSQQGAQLRMQQGRDGGPVLRRMQTLVTQDPRPSPFRANGLPV
jgi:hypothetical protein